MKNSKKFTAIYALLLIVLSGFLLSSCVGEREKEGDKSGGARYEGARMEFLAAGNRQKMVLGDSTGDVIPLDCRQHITLKGICEGDGQGKGLDDSAAEESPMECIAYSDTLGKDRIVCADCKTGKLYVCRLKKSGRYSCSSVLTDEYGVPLLKGAVSKIPGYIFVEPAPEISV